MAGPGREFPIAHGAKLPAQGLLRDGDAEFLEDPLPQIDQPPANDPIHRRHRTVLNHRRQRLTLRIVQLWRLSRSLAVHEPVRSLCIEPQHPIPDRLQTDAADPGRIMSRRTVVNLCQGQTSPRMPTISRSPGQHPQIPRREILAERNCRCHHIPLCPRAQKNHDLPRAVNPEHESNSQGLGITPSFAFFLYPWPSVTHGLC